MGVVFDGAMGTMLIQLGADRNNALEMLNINDADMVKSVHEKYLKSGADVISSNTFGANKARLKEYNLEDKVFEINYEGVKLAKEMADKYGKKVAASVGPTGLFLKHMDTTLDDFYKIYTEQIEAIAKANPDFILLETFYDLNEIKMAIKAIKDICKVPFICTMTYEGTKTFMGVDAKESTKLFECEGACAIGTNCSNGPRGLFEVTSIIKSLTKLPVLVQANAGLPKIEGTQKMRYDLGIDEFINDMKPYVKLGIDWIGSCCGTNPDYTRAIKSELIK